MKHLPKHVRPRWRYLAVEVETWPDASLSRGTFQRELWFAAQNLVGDAESADADLTVLDFEFSDGVGRTVVRARRGTVDVARAVLACMDEIDGYEVGVRVTGVSGTVRACEERYLGSPAGDAVERDVVFAGADCPALEREAAFDVRLPSGFVGAATLDFD